MSFRSDGVISFKHTGDLGDTTRFLGRLKNRRIMSSLERYAKKGVTALANATPKDTGKTASSWDYEIIQEGENVTINWTNTNINKGVNIAVIIQYGHGTKNGGYVAGRDYINPAIQPIFDEMVADIWKEVTD